MSGSKITDYAIAAFLIGVLSFIGQIYHPAPVDPDAPPVEPPIVSPVQQPALIVVDDFEDSRTIANAYLMNDETLVDKLKAFAPNDRFRYWDDEAKPTTEEFQDLLSKAVAAGGGIGGSGFPTYAIGKGGKSEAGKFSESTIDDVLARWGK